MDAHHKEAFSSRALRVSVPMGFILGRSLDGNRFVVAIVALMASFSWRGLVGLLSTVSDT